MLKQISVAFVAVCVAIGCCQSSSQNKAEPAPEPERRIVPAGNLDFPKLLASRCHLNTLCLEDYVGKSFTVTGTIVMAMGRHKSGQAYILGGAPGASVEVLDCRLTDAAASQAAKLKVGEPFSFKGEVRKLYDFDNIGVLRFEACEIVTTKKGSKS
jgi:hypothetical protein